MDGWSYLGAFRTAELRGEKRHNIELVFCNLDQLGFNLALLPAVSVAVCVWVRGPLTCAVGSNLCHLESRIPAGAGWGRDLCHWKPGISSSKGKKRSLAFGMAGTQ